MKAIGLKEAGTKDSLALMEIPIPSIDPEEVLVRVKAIGVGLHDRWFMPQDARFPYPIGIEASGVIEAVGSAVPGFHVGERVMFTSTMQPKGGVWAEYAAVASRGVLQMPDELDFVRAAALPVAGGTALDGMRLLDLSSGDTVFMAGASGAIGTITIQLAAALGSRVAASASPQNHEYMKGLGAELTVDYHDPAWPDQVREWSPGGVDAALAIQPGTGVECLRIVRDGGKIVTVSGDKMTTERGIEIQQVAGGGGRQQALADLAAKVASGDIHVEIEKVYPFEQGVRALEKTETRRARGKVVVLVE